MAIRRIKNKDNFTTVNNQYLQDTELSWKAKGLITYLMSLPEDWNVNISDLTNRSKDGRDAVSATLKEISDKMYGRKIKGRNLNGQFDKFDFEVSDTKLPITEKPLTGFPITEKPITENPTLLNTNNTKYLKRVNTNSKFDFKKSVLELGVSKLVLNDWMIVRKNKKASNTETAFKALVSEIAKSGLSANECIKLATENDWKGFKAIWLNNQNNLFSKSKSTAPVSDYGDEPLC